jgi:phosphate:Na+ symporter
MILNFCSLIVSTFPVLSILPCVVGPIMPSLDSAGGLIMLVTGLAGGLGLFLMGIKMISDSLTKSTGNEMRDLLARLTHNKYLAFLSGIFITMVFQSSSATTVMLVSLVNSRLIRFVNTVGVIIGAAVGATITIQIIAFKITDYALVIITAGFVAYIISKQPRSRNYSLAIIGAGILFLGMSLMSQSIAPLRSSETIIRSLLQLENPWLGILAGALLTALLQSTTAFMGIIIILAGQGLLSLTASVPLLLGANIGTAITAVIASIGTSRESKQVVLAHTLFKTIGALIIVGWIPQFVMLVTAISPGGMDAAGAEDIAMAPRQIANAHTAFNILVALVFLPFAGPYSRLIARLLPVKDKKQDSLSTWYIDEGMLHSPSLALSLARQEVLRMMEVAQRMTEDIIVPFMEKNSASLKQILKREEELDFLREAINGYLVKIVRMNLTSNQVEEAFQMMYAIDEYEQIGDILSGSLFEKAEIWCGRKVYFSAMGREEILDFHLKTLKILYQSYRAFKGTDIKEARKSKESYSHFRKQYFELEKQHYERLKEDIEGSAESSRTHLEVIASLKGVGSHATNIARILLEEHLGSKKQKKQK